MNEVIDQLKARPPSWCSSLRLQSRAGQLEHLIYLPHADILREGAIVLRQIHLSSHP